jgi:hypothetical protein
MLAPRLKQLEEDLLEEPRDPRESFWDEVKDEGRYVGQKHRLYTQVCRFNQKGLHTVMAKNCPHFKGEDETGRSVRDGWTVQS